MTTIQQTMCAHCGKPLSPVWRDRCHHCGTPMALANPGAFVAQPAPQTYAYAPAQRSRLVAALLAIFLGGLGVHKFYLGKVAQGVIYLLFCWTFVPLLLGLIEGIWYLTMADTDFWSRYPVTR